MQITKNWDYIDFDLGLNIFPAKQGWFSSNDFSKMQEIKYSLIERIENTHPYIDLHQPFHGSYGIDKHGYAISARAKVEPFMKDFGEVNRGIYITIAPILIPISIEVDWFPKNELVVPDNLSDIIKDVSPSRNPLGSFSKFYIHKA